MSNYVWVSTARTDARFGLSVKTDISTGAPERAIDAQSLIDDGQPVPASMCPTRLWADAGAPDHDKMPFAKIPPLFGAGGFWIVSGKAAGIIGSFDLGGGSLYPVSQGLFAEDEKTRVPGEFFVWIIGNQKSAFLPAETMNKRPFGVAGLRWKLPWTLNDLDIAVSRAAEAGPASWIDPALFNAVFVSRALGDALDAAGLTKAFHLFKARIA
jgi:hypothetical protein